MEQPEAPEFDAWVEGIFAGEPEFPEPVVVCEYLTRLMTEPAWLAHRFDDGQLAAGLWRLFGCETEYFKDVWWGGAPPDAQERCLRAVLTFYQELLDQVCCMRGGDPDRDYTDEQEVDIAVYMIWDMDGLDCAVSLPQKTPHLVGPGFAVLGSILTECRTATCLKSALHGLGHLWHEHPARVEQTIDRALAARPLPSHLVEYAAAARCGGVL